MKKRAIALKINKQSEREILLSAGLLLAAMSGLTGLPVGAQSIDQDSCLPPEVIPVTTSVKYSAAESTAAVVASNGSRMGGLAPAPTDAPGLAGTGTVASNGSMQSTPTNTQAPMQSAQEARQALFNSLMGTNVYPQFSGQNTSFSQDGNMAGVQNVPQSMPQTLSNAPQGQSNFSAPSQYNSFNSSTPSQYNNLMTSTPSQTQTLTGSANTPSTSQPRTSAGVAGLAGLVAGVGVPVLSAASSGGAGGIYDVGYFGSSLLNMGLHF